MFVLFLLTFFKIVGRGRGWMEVGEGIEEKMAMK